jgi:hypothetical protein
VRERPSQRCCTFLRCSEINEECAEYQHELRRQKTVQPHADREHAAHPRSHLRGFFFCADKTEQRAKDSASVHRKGGNQVETSQQQVSEGQARQHIGIAQFDHILEADGRRGVRQPQQRKDSRGKQQICQRTRRGDPQFLLRLQHALHTRDAADGEHHDFDGLHVKPGTGPGMRQFV